MYLKHTQYLDNNQCHMFFKKHFFFSFLIQFAPWKPNQVVFSLLFLRRKTHSHSYNIQCVNMHLMQEIALVRKWQETGSKKSISSAIVYISETVLATIPRREILFPSGYNPRISCFILQPYLLCSHILHSEALGSYQQNSPICTVTLSIEKKLYRALSWCLTLSLQDVMLQILVCH